MSSSLLLIDVPERSVIGIGEEGLRFCLFLCLSWSLSQRFCRPPSSDILALYPCIAQWAARLSPQRECSRVNIQEKKFRRGRYRKNAALHLNQNFVGLFCSQPVALNLGERGSWPLGLPRSIAKIKGFSPKMLPSTTRNWDEVRNFDQWHSRATRSGHLDNL
jgi:hypothetical protein